ASLAHVAAGAVFATAVDVGLVPVLDLVAAARHLTDVAFAVLGGAVAVGSASSRGIARPALFTAAVDVGLVAVVRVVGARRILTTAIGTLPVFAVGVDLAQFADAARLARAATVQVTFGTVDAVVVAVRRHAVLTRD